MKHHKNLKFSLLLPGAVLLGLAAASPARADYPTTLLSQGPVGYWQLNETTQPLSYTVQATNQGSLGANDNGSYNGSAQRGVTGPFTGSLAVNLDGLSQSVTAGFDASANPNTFTVELWAKPAQVPKFAYVASSVHLGSPRSGWYLAQDDGSTFGFGSAFVVRMFYQNAANPSITLHAPLDTNAPPAWYHLVLTYDGTTATLYTNGVVAQSGAPLGYVANVDSPFSVGCRSDNGFFWPGQAAEVAMYTGALSSTRVSAHYTTATTTPANYAAAVATDSPLIYWRFREPADPVAANSGSLGAAANGKYVYSARPGVQGPVPTPFPGFTSGNKAVAFDGVGGSVTLPPLHLNTNTVTFTGWINATGQQAAATGLIMSRAGSTVAGLTVDVAGGLRLAYNWNNDNATYNWSFGPTLPDSSWAFVALVVQPTEAEIYVVDGTNFTTWTASTNYLNHPNQLFEGPTLIGTDPGFTTNRTFNGAIDEVAVFTRSLSAGEVYSQYAAGVGGLPPVIFADPQTPVNPTYVSDPLNLYVDAGGTPSLSYQWRKGGVAQAGATASTFALASLTPGDAGNYDVIITNNFGAITSQVASITVSPIASPVITESPVGRNLFAGGVLRLVVGATGGQLRYQWAKNSTAITGATNPVYLVASATAADSGSYVVTVTNSLGSISSSPAAVINVTTPAVGSYAATVLADTPESYWRLDETSGELMFDALGRHDGAYTNGQPTLGAAGALKADADAGISTDGSAPFVGFVPYAAFLGSKEFAVECWAKVADTAASYAPISMHNSAKDGFFLYSDPVPGWRTGVGTPPDPYTWYYLNDTFGAEVVPGKWMHLVLTYSAGPGLRAYINGQNNGGYGDFPRPIGFPLLIGGVLAPINMIFKGSIDEVAFYTHGLSAAQVNAHYVAGLYGSNSVPVFTIQPPTQSALVVGQSVTLTTLAEGSVPITYQWFKDGAPLANETNNTLALNNVTFAAAGTYAVRATNPVGNTFSVNDVITVSPLPSFVNATNGLVLHLRFDNNLNDSSGRNNNGTPVGAPTFVAGKLGNGALHYNTVTATATYNYVTLGSPTDLLFSSNVNFSVSYWVRQPAGATNGDLPFLCSALNSTFSPGLTLAPSYKLGGWAWSVNGTGKYGADASINDGNWHNVVTLFDRAGNAVTYLDGAQVDSTSISSAGDIDVGNAFNIGQDPSGTYGESGSADLDDLGIWRRLLTQSEASAIYYAGRNGTSFDTYGPVSMFITPSAANLIITWQAGTLLEAPTLSGPWTTVSGATPPNYKVTPGPGNKFYRIQL